jgi:hypothetical protein
VADNPATAQPEVGSRVRVVADKCPPSLVGRVGTVVSQSGNFGVRFAGQLLVRFSLPHDAERHFWVCPCDLEGEDD